MLEIQWKIPKKEKRRYIDADGNKLPSVTEILDALGWNKGALMGWANKIGRGGQTINQVRGPKADAGSLGHHLIECCLGNINYQDTQEWHEALPEIQEKAKVALDAWQAYVPSLYAAGWSIDDVEIALQNDTQGFAGTCDLLLRHEDGYYAVADIKTGSPHAEAAIQMAGYASLLRSVKNIVCDHGFIFHVPTDGRPVTQHLIGVSDFQAACEVWENLLTIQQYKDHFKDMGKRIDARTPKLPEEEPVKGPF